MHIAQDFEGTCIKSSCGEKLYVFATSIMVVDIVSSLMDLIAYAYYVVVGLGLITSVKTFFGSKTVSDFIAIYYVNCHVDL